MQKRLPREPFSQVGKTPRDNPTRLRLRIKVILKKIYQHRKSGYIHPQPTQIDEVRDFFCRPHLREPRLAGFMVIVIVNSDYIEIKEL